MPDLVAQGPRRQQRWRKRIPHGIKCELGRKAGPFSAVWDDHISRKHVTICWNDGHLTVELLPNVANPMFFAGERIDSVDVEPGQHFVLGETTFSVVDESAGFGAEFDALVTEQTFSVQNIRHHRFLDPASQLEILSQLPEQIARANNDEEIYELLVRIIFEGMPGAECVALCATAESDGEANPIRFLYWDRTNPGALQVSHRLIAKTIETQKTIVHTWESVNENTIHYTEAENATWAFATPFSGNATRGWALYVAGSDRQSPTDGEVAPLQDEMKFAELVVTTVSSFVEVQKLQQRHSALGQFFSTPVIAAMGDEDPDEILAPREVEVSVLFCDLRGFSLATEQAEGDLLGLLQRVSDALGVLTSNILREGGVIGDFHGDAAMGFWGWPLTQSDAAARAARAAIEIQREFERVANQSDHSLSNFRIGVGVASGRAVAGKIGTVDQVKVTAFGPAVNLAARLETMTKQLNTSILVDAQTASQVAGTQQIRTRRLAIVKPYGMAKAIEVWQLLPSEEEFPLLSDGDIAKYEQSLEHFLDGDWATAWELLHQVPAGDRSKDFLTTYIASRNRKAPDDWDGIIRLDSK